MSIQNIKLPQTKEEYFELTKLIIDKNDAILEDSLARQPEDLALQTRLVNSQALEVTKQLLKMVEAGDIPFPEAENFSLTHIKAESKEQVKLMTNIIGSAITEAYIVNNSITFKEFFIAGINLVIAASNAMQTEAYEASFNLEETDEELESLYQEIYSIKH